jgi:hypothetical protein
VPGNKAENWVDVSKIYLCNLHAECIIISRVVMYIITFRNEMLHEYLARPSKGHAASIAIVMR